MDKNMEDSDIGPAPKLIEVVFQNCKGQIDHYIEPYLRIAISRLQRAEKSYLKCLLIEVVIIFIDFTFIIHNMDIFLSSFID